ncbi:MAG: hypothetical protein A3G81_30305 [Betaproteobacteria bacterium RIFCSPLOWO2_12_FULL_65_14]|nr:MAG: hypothetical protein A3G81_30305 [Betaproteobacteria bacterium RIFCSPLOWO2_12_FULL_65_14]
MDRLILVLLTLTVAWGALAFGAVYQWAYRPLLIAAALTGVLAWLRADRRAAPVAVIVAVLATGAAIALQLLPLDHSTLARHFPGTHRILSETNFAYNAAVSSGTPFAHPLSVSPGRTTIGLVFLGCTAMFVLGVSRWLTRDRLRHLAIVITAFGVVLALEGIIQRAVSPGLVYGFWQSEQGGTAFGPFINGNHFAGWMLMGLPITLGLVAGLATRGRGRRARDWRERLLRFGQPESAGATMALFAAFVMMVALLLTLSRSAIATAPVSLALALLLTTRAVRGWAQRSAVIVGALGAAAVAWVGIDMLATRFAQLDAVSSNARAGMWLDTWRMAQDVPLAGVGIRAYTVASLLYQTVLPRYHVGAAHNDWLQLLAEGGLLVAAPALFLLGALIAETGRRFREHRNANDFGTTYWIRVGAATGILAISLQSLVEFSLQMPGNTMMFAVLWAIAIAPTPRGRADSVLAHGVIERS